MRPLLRRGPTERCRRSDQRCQTVWVSALRDPSAKACNCRTGQSFENGTQITLPTRCIPRRVAEPPGWSCGTPTLENCDLFREPCIQLAFSRAPATSFHVDPVR